jgi:hypothetical protein
MTGTPALPRPLVGPLMTAVGAIHVAITEQERRDPPLPASLPVTMAALGVWGVVLMPKSPFWVFGPLAALAAVRRRTVRR